MAKRASDDGGVNVSAAIRDYRNTHRRAKPKAIAEALAAQGIHVKPGYVSTILSMDRRKKRGKSSGSEEGAEPGRRGRKPASDKFDALVNDLQMAKQLVDKLGGLEKAKAALAALSKLQ